MKRFVPTLKGSQKAVNAIMRVEFSDFFYTFDKGIRWIDGTAAPPEAPPRTGAEIAA